MDFFLKLCRFFSYNKIQYFSVELLGIFFDCRQEDKGQAVFVFYLIFVELIVSWDREELGVWDLKQMIKFIYFQCVDVIEIEMLFFIFWFGRNLRV